VLVCNRQLLSVALLIEARACWCLSKSDNISRSKTLEERHDRAAELSFLISFPYVVKEGKQEVFPEGI